MILIIIMAFITTIVIISWSSCGWTSGIPLFALGFPVSPGQAIPGCGFSPLITPIHLPLWLQGLLSRGVWNISSSQDILWFCFILLTSSLASYFLLRGLQGCLRRKFGKFSFCVRRNKRSFSTHSSHHGLHNYHIHHIMVFITTTFITSWSS